MSSSEMSQLGTFCHSFPRPKKSISLLSPLSPVISSHSLHTAPLRGAHRPSRRLPPDSWLALPHGHPLIHKQHSFTLCPENPGGTDQSKPSHSNSASKITGGQRPVLCARTTGNPSQNNHGAAKAQDFPQAGFHPRAKVMGENHCTSSTKGILLTKL